MCDILVGDGLPLDPFLDRNDETEGCSFVAIEPLSLPVGKLKNRHPCLLFILADLLAVSAQASVVEFLKVWADVPDCTC